MMRIGTAAIGVALAGLCWLPANEAAAQAPLAGVRAAPTPASELSAQRRRPLKRVPIYPRYEQEPQPDVYPRYNPGPDAVRDCTATYVQEYRPSGTVIVPRMNCYWRRG